MQDLLFSLNKILPIILLLSLGYFLKHIKLGKKETFEALNKLCFRVFLPVSLFKSVYTVGSIKDFNLTFILFVILTTIILFLIGLIGVKLFVKDNKQKGVILQAFVRPNYAIIGIPLVEFIAGAKGLQVAAIGALVSIPLFNILGIISLTSFIETNEKKSIVTTLKKIITNPLILGVLTGIVALLIRSTNIKFRLTDIEFLYSFIDKVGSIASPLALISLGGQFEFSQIRRVRKELITVVSVRQFIIPFVVFTIVYLLFNFNGPEVAVLIAMFGAPCAVSSAVMANEMNNDGELANQIVVWTTIFSMLTIFLLILIFKSLGVLI